MSIIIEFIIMQKSTVLKEVQRIHREGFISKQSRFLKTWRQSFLPYLDAG